MKKLTKNINSNFNPNFVGSYPVYGFGSWLKKNAGIVGTIGGAAIGTIIAPGVGTEIGAQLGGQVGGAVQQGDEQTRAMLEEEKNNRTNELLGQLGQQNQYGAVMANGGGLSRSKDYGSKSKPYPSVSKGDFAGGGRSYPIPTKADAVDALRLAGLHGRSDVKAKVYAKYPGLKKEFGGLLESYGINSPMNFNNTQYASGGKLDNTTYYANGGTHEQNPNGGIPLGRNALVEEGEYRYDSPKRGSYIFSNRF